MYIDHQRSWFLHNNVHSHRTEGGIDVGSTVGVLLDLDRRQLSFYVNEEPQVKCLGMFFFAEMAGLKVFVNRCVGNGRICRPLWSLLSSRFAQPERSSDASFRPGSSTGFGFFPGQWRGK